MRKFVNTLIIFSLILSPYSASGMEREIELMPIQHKRINLEQAENKEEDSKEKNTKKKNLSFSNINTLSEDEIKIIEEQEEEKKSSSTLSPMPFFPNFALEEEIEIVENLENQETSIELENEPQNISLLLSYIKKHLIQKEPVLESCGKKYLRKSTPFISLLLGGITTSIPFFTIGYKAGRGNTALAYAVAVPYTISNSGSAVWGYFNVLKGFSEQCTPEEIMLLKENKESRATKFAAHTISLFTPVPITYQVYRYNTHKWFALIVYGCLYCFDTLGLKAFFHEITSRYPRTPNENPTEKEKIIEKFRELVTSHLINKTIPTLLTLKEADRVLFYRSLKEMTTPEQYLSTLLTLSEFQPPEIENPEDFKNGCPKKTFVRTISIMPFLTMLCNMYSGYRGWSLIFSSNYLVIPCTLLGVIPTFSLDLKATINTSKSLFDSVYHVLKGGASPSLDETLYPTFSKALPIASMGLGLVVAYVCQFVDYDILTDTFSSIIAFILSSGSIVSCLFLSTYTNLSIQKDLRLMYSRSWGSEDEKKLASFVQNVEKLSEIIGNAKREELEKLMNSPIAKESIPQFKQAEEAIKLSQAQLQVSNPQPRGTREGWCSRIWTLYSMASIISLIIITAYTW